MPGGKPKRHILRRGFEDKVWAALRVQSGCPRSEVGADMGVAESTLRGWIHEKSIQEHAGDLECVVQLTLLKVSPVTCRNDVFDPEDLRKDVFHRAAELNRFKKRRIPSTGSCGSDASASSSAPATPTTSGSDNLHQCPEALPSHLSRKRLHSEGYNSDGSSSSSTAEYHQKKKMRIDFGPQYHLDITMSLDNVQPSCTGAEAIEKGAVTPLGGEDGR